MLHTGRTGIGQLARHAEYIKFFRERDAEVGGMVGSICRSPMAGGWS